MSLTESQSKEDIAQLDVLLRRLADAKSHVSGLKEWLHARSGVYEWKDENAVFSARFSTKSMHRSC